MLLLVPVHTAQACSPDECEYSDRWRTFEPAFTTVAPDGVVVFQTYRGGDQLSQLEALAYASFTLSDGQTDYEGTFEWDEAWEAVIWRPLAPLPAGETLTGTLVVDNDAIAEEPAWCGEQIGQQPISLTVGQPLPPLEAPAFEVSESYDLDETLELDTVVCCDGAYPELDFGCGPEGVYWSDGECAAKAGVGRVRALIAWPEGLLPEVAADRRFRIGNFYSSLTNATASRRDTEPYCVTPEIHSYATGEVISGGELCFGDAFAGKLGEVAIDPLVALAGVCADTPYACAAVDGAWDPNQCEPWGQTGTTAGPDTDTDGSGTDSDGSDGSEGSDSEGSDSDGATTGDFVDDKGCACTSNPAEPSWAWLALVLVWPRRRRG